MNTSAILFLILFIIWNFGSVAIGIIALISKKYFPKVFASYYALSNTLFLFSPFIIQQIKNEKFYPFVALILITNLIVSYFGAYFFYKYVVMKVSSHLTNK